MIAVLGRGAMAKVQAYVYDISQGMASQMSMALVGKHVELIPHTGIVVFGKEYFFGSGPCQGQPGQTVGMPPTKILDLGTTSKTMQELEAHIRSALAGIHSAENYNLCNHNCNHYADDVVKFLLDGQGLPDGIVNVADEALSTPQGQSLRAMIETMDAQMRSNTGGSTLNPFGNMDSSAANAAPIASSGHSAPNALGAPAARGPLDGQPLPIPAPGTITLDGALSQLLANPRDTAKTAIQTLISIAENIIHKPKEEKFRRLKLGNAALQRKLLGLPGGAATLVALGFAEGLHDGEAVLIVRDDKTVLDLLVSGKARLSVEYEKLQSTPIDAAKQKQNNSTGGIMGMVENALRDPASLQRLLSNPMIAQMARANPQLIEEALGNPEVQQALQQHPEMRGQIEQLLGRPLPAALAPTAAAAPALSAPATQTFEAQLRQLAEMGFHDRSACLAALQTSGGDIELALATLVG